MSDDPAVAFFLRELVRERTCEVLALAHTRRRASICRPSSPRNDSLRWAHRHESLKARSRLYQYALAFRVDRSEVRAAVSEFLVLYREHIDRQRNTLAHWRDESRKVSK